MGSYTGAFVEGSRMKDSSPTISAESFKNLEKALYTALCEGPIVWEIVCSSLLILIQQTKGTIDGKIDLHGPDASISRQRALTSYALLVAVEHGDCLRGSVIEEWEVCSQSNDFGLMRTTELENCFPKFDYRICFWIDLCANPVSFRSHGKLIFDLEYWSGGVSFCNTNDPEFWLPVPLMPR